MSKPIENFRAKLGSKQIVIYGCFGLFLVPALAAIAVPSLFDFSKFKIVLAILTLAILHTLAYIILGIAEIYRKKIVIFKDGIELWNPTAGNRTKIKWELITNAKIDNQTFGQQATLFDSDTKKIGVIPWPIKNEELLLHHLLGIIGKNHPLVSIFNITCHSTRRS